MSKGRAEDTGSSQPFRPSVKMHISGFGRVLWPVGLLLLLFLHRGSAAASQNLALTPFRDQSGFSSKWKLSRGIPALLGKLLAEDPSYTIIPVDSVEKAMEERQLKKPTDQQLAELGREMGADAMITGEILNFTVGRFHVGNPFLGGYMSYSATTEAQISVLRTLDGRRIGEATGKETIKDRNLGLTLLGRPGEKDTQFFGLDRIIFGSEEFRETIIGRTTLNALTQIKEQIHQIATDPSAVDKTLSAIVLSVEKGQVYVDLGVEDQVEVGHKFAVYAAEAEEVDTGDEGPSTSPEERIGLIQITKVYAAHLSEARIVEGEGDIKPGDHVRPEPSK